MLRLNIRDVASQKVLVLGIFPVRVAIHVIIYNHNHL